MGKKISRNEPCFCGSGKKYKKCCLNKLENINNNFDLIRLRLQARQQQIIKQQGLGKQIISEIFDNKRFIAVGKKLFYNDKNKWQTFYDFLGDYLRLTLGYEWINQETKKGYSEQHPIVQWAKLSSDHFKKNYNGKYIIPTGALAAITQLSYNLYLLEHNAEVQERLIKRLKNIDQFRGALYEIQVAASLIISGFSIEMEEETDSSNTHCEFTITPNDSSIKYSVEAKARNANKKNISIGNQLYKALKKDVKNNKRVIFIEMNIPDLNNKIPEIVEELKRKESSLTIDGKPAPSAYLFITNHSYIYNLEDTNFERMGFIYGFKIDDFYNIYETATLRDAINSREKHKDIEHLIGCLKDYNNIPATFDGEIPLFVLDDKARENRLLIGDKYIVPDKNGNESIGELINATVLEHEQQVFGIYKLENGKHILCKCPLSNEEFEVYKQFPDTFFGITLQTNKKIVNILDLYDFFYSTYKNSTREKLLEFMNIQPNDERFIKHSQQELASIYCEQLVYNSEITFKN